MTSLVLKNLVKVYNGRQVVNGVEVVVNQGEVTGLLGPTVPAKQPPFTWPWG